MIMTGWRRSPEGNLNVVGCLCGKWGVGVIPTRKMPLMTGKDHNHDDGARTSLTISLLLDATTTLMVRLFPGREMVVVILMMMIKTTASRLMA